MTSSLNKIVMKIWFYFVSLSREFSKQIQNSKPKTIVKLTQNHNGKYFRKIRKSCDFVRRWIANYWNAFPRPFLGGKPKSLWWSSQKSCWMSAWNGKFEERHWWTDSSGRWAVQTFWWIFEGDHWHFSGIRREDWRSWAACGQLWICCGQQR